MKQYLLVAAAFLIVAPPVLGQDNPSESTQPMKPLNMAEIAPAELQGVDVMGKDGDAIGRITSIVFTSTGEMQSAVVSTGGFLGFGRHSVAIPVTELTVAVPPEQMLRIVVSLPVTEDELRAMPDVNSD